VPIAFPIAFAAAKRVYCSTMTWETFQRQRAPLSEEPTITIQRRGTLSLNAAAHSALENPEAVELLFDRSTRRMALRKAEPSTSHAYLVRPLGKGGSTWLVSGQAFTRYYGIDSEKAMRWDAKLDSDGLLVVDLNDPGTEVTGNRKQAEEPDLQERSPLFG
jgi:hypothetical protein